MLENECLKEGHDKFFLVVSCADNPMIVLQEDGEFKNAEYGVPRTTMIFTEWADANAVAQEQAQDSRVESLESIVCTAAKLRKRVEQKHNYQYVAIEHDRYRYTGDEDDYPSPLTVTHLVLNSGEVCGVVCRYDEPTECCGTRYFTFVDDEYECVFKEDWELLRNERGPGIRFSDN